MCLGINWISEIMVQFVMYCTFHKAHQSHFHNCFFFFAAVNHNYNQKQWALNHRNTQSGSKTTNHKPWPFEPVTFCVLRVRLKWLTAVKNENVSWLLNFRICMFLKKCSNTLLRDWDCFLSPVAINDKGGHELKVEKLGPNFSIFNSMTAEMSPKNFMACAPCGRNCRLDTCIFFITPQVKHLV